jgi:DNA-binding IclR family transcriptional regulator
VLQTVKRVGEVLSLFSDERPTLTTGDVAREVEISRSAARELLASMTDVQLLNQSVPGRYRLGRSAVQLTNTLLSSAALTRVAFPLITELNSKVHESFEFVVNQNGVARVVDFVAGTMPVSVRVPAVGSSRELHCTATGKIVLAWSDERHRIYRTVPPTVYTAATLSTRLELDSEIKKIRQRGVSFDRGEYIEEVRCFACPVLSASGELLGAIGIATPEHRFSRSLSIAQPMMAASATAISRAMAVIATRR